MAIRLGIGDGINLNGRNKAKWLKLEPDDRNRLPQASVGWDVVAAEAKFDTWWVRHEEQSALASQPWHRFEELRNGGD